MKVFNFMFAAIAAALFSLPIGNASADIVTLDFTNDGGSVGVDLDTNPGLDELPFAVDAGDGLVLTVTAATGVGDLTLNGTGGSFGVNSAGSDSTARFDADLGESVTISFNRDVDIFNINFNGLSAAEGFLVGDVAVVGGENSVDFAEGVLSFEAGEGIFLTSTGGANGDAEVGIAQITLHVKAVPEPSSALLLAMGAGAFGLVRRRR